MGGIVDVVGRVSVGRVGRVRRVGRVGCVIVVGRRVVGPGLRRRRSRGSWDALSSAVGRVGRGRVCGAWPWVSG